MEPMHIVTQCGRDGPGGEWAYSECRPPQLAGVVDVMWAFKGPTSSRRKRILPSGRLELLVNFAEPYRLLEGAGRERLDRVWVGGVLTAPMVVAQPAFQDVMGVRLRPVAAYALLATPLRELVGQAVALHDLIGAVAEELAERCAGIASVAERFRTVAAWLTARLHAARRADPTVAWTAGRIEDSGGIVSIRALRAESGWSKARLAATFREQLGLTPKLYARVVRFGRVLGMLQTGAEPLIEVALAAGYYDQPHMNADFRESAASCRASSSPRAIRWATAPPQPIVDRSVGAPRRHRTFFQDRVARPR